MKTSSGSVEQPGSSQTGTAVLLQEGAVLEDGTPSGQGEPLRLRRLDGRAHFPHMTEEIEGVY
jgi:hypothetical protein